MPYDWPIPPICASAQVRCLPYVEYLESQIGLLEERQLGVRRQGPTRRILDIYKQEFQRVISERSPQVRPLPHIVRHAIEFRQLIWDLETNIRDHEARIKIPNTEPKGNFRDTLDSLRDRLRKAKINCDRLPPIRGLPPPVHSSDGFEWHSLPNGLFMITPAGPRPRVLRSIGIIEEFPDARANTVANDDHNVRTGFRGDLNSPDDPVVRTSATTRDRFGELFQGRHPTRRVISSIPTIVPPQTLNSSLPTIVPPILKVYQTLNSSLPTIVTPQTHAGANWYRLPPIRGLLPPVSSSRGGGNFDWFSIPHGGTIADARVGTVASGDHNVMMGFRGDLNSPDGPAVRTSATTRDRFGELYQGRQPTRRANSSTPTIVPPQTHGKANHAVTEDLTTGDGTSVGPVSGEELGGGDHGTIAHGTGTDASSDPNPTSVDEVQHDTRDPVAAAPPGSRPHGDADLECPDLTPDIGSEEDEMEIDEVSLIHDHDGDGDGSAASRSYLQATAARALASMGPAESEVDDALDEELYGDGY